MHIIQMVLCTGKTYLAKSIATECKTTCMSVNSLMFCTKWLGESEKYVQSLVELAYEPQPFTLWLYVIVYNGMNK